MAGVFLGSALEDEAKALAACAGRPVFGGRDHLALPESPGSPWFDALGNALALEALSHPRLASNAAPLRDGIAAFLPALEDQGALRRRAGPGRLRIASDDTRRFHIETPSHVFTGDLWRGVLRQALRADPARPVALHTGNTVFFRLGGRAQRVDVENSIAACGIDPLPGGVRLFHESRIAGRGLFGLTSRAIGRLRYAYEIRADTPVVRLSVLFTPDDALPARLVLTTALDGMSPGDGVAYDHVTGLAGGAPFARHDLPAGTAALQDGPVETLGFHQGNGGPAALAIALRPHAPAQARATVRAGGQLHWAVLRHEGPTVTEDRLVLAGHPRPDIDAIFARHTRQDGRDLSLCPAPGLALQAIAAYRLWRDRTGAAPDPALDAMLGRLRRALQPCETGAGLAGLVLAEEALARCGLASDHGAALDALLEDERRGRLDAPHARAATVLALARSATLPAPAPGLPAAVARCLAGLAGDPPSDEVARSLLPRGLRALHVARATGALEVDEDSAALAARLTLREEAWLRDRAPRQDDPTALRAALMTARLAPDALVMRLAPSYEAA